MQSTGSVTPQARSLFTCGETLLFASGLFRFKGLLRPLSEYTSLFFSVLGLGGAEGGRNRLRSLISWPIRIRYIRRWRLRFVRNLFEGRGPDIRYSDGQPTRICLEHALARYGLIDF